MLREVLESVKVCWRKLRNAELHLFQSLVRRQIVSTFTVIHTFSAICISFKLPNITTIPSQCVEGGRLGRGSHPYFGFTRPPLDSETSLPSNKILH